MIGDNSERSNVPLIEIPVMLTATLPLLLNVIRLERLLVPTG
jgi:hypothetical protein